MIKHTGFLESSSTTSTLDVELDIIFTQIFCTLISNTNTKFLDTN